MVKTKKIYFVQYDGFIENKIEMRQGANKLSIAPQT